MITYNKKDIPEHLQKYFEPVELGLEPTFQEYISKLCDIFDEVKRVLKKEGTCWVNLGDSYYSISGGKFENDNIGSKNRNELKGLSRGNELKKGKELKQKNLCNIPARFSIEMQDRGWILRNLIIWHKPNCIPSSVKDRFTVDYEMLYLFAKNKKYFFETQYEPHLTLENRPSGIVRNRIRQGYKAEEHFYSPQGRNKRCIWTITTKPFKDGHFAVYPEKLCETPIKAGCPEFVCNKCGKARETIYKSNAKKREIKWHNEKYGNNDEKQRRLGRMQPKQSVYNTSQKIGLTNCGCNAGFSEGIVLDLFFGSGTTGLVALKQNKNFIGIELNPEYIKIAEARLKPYLEQKKLLTDKGQ